MDKRGRGDIEDVSISDQGAERGGGGGLGGVVFFWRDERKILALIIRRGGLSCKMQMDAFKPGRDDSIE